jgi:DNA-binding transcriptional MerR regulator
MISLESVRKGNPRWSLDEFVEKVNRLSPRFLPGEEVGRGSVQQEVSARLVRHYTSAGLVDRPGREGKEARYGFRHLLQMLVLRRLLLEGLTAQAIAPITTGRDDHELEALLEGGGRLTIEPANPAVAFLQKIRRRGEQARPGGPGGPDRRRRWRPERPGEPSWPADVLAFAGPPADALAREAPGLDLEEEWKRVTLVPGLELHVRDGFAWPDHPRDRSLLVSRLTEVLETLTEQGRKRS